MCGRLFSFVAALGMSACVGHEATRVDGTAPPAAVAPSSTASAESPLGGDAGTAGPAAASQLDAGARTEALVGCWKVADQDERWRFVRAGEGGLEVSREVDPAGSDYARRAKIPAKVSYDAATDTFGFPAAGRIHALLFTFKQKGEVLEADSYTKHTPSEAYRFTGSHFALQRCASR